MLSKIITTIEQHGLINIGDRIVVAVSGGIDSVVLLHVLAGLRKDYNLDLLAAHLNHGFRGEEAQGDALFVRDFAQKLGLPSIIEEISVPQHIKETGQSPQEAARNIRYRFLEKARENFRGRAIAVGQNANDQAETVLINLMRGGASSGLKGIPIKRGFLIRPLLEVRREEIEHYAHEHNLTFRFDSSNNKTIYLRNKIRLKLLPLLEEEYNPMLVANLGKTAAIMADEDKYLSRIAANALEQLMIAKKEGIYELDLIKFNQEDLAIKRRIIRLLCSWLKRDQENLNLGFDHVEQVLTQIAAGRTGAKIKLPGKILILKQYNRLYAGTEKQMEAWENDEPFPANPISLSIPGKTIIPQAGLRLETDLTEEFTLRDWLQLRAKNEACLDWDKLPGGKLFIRFRKEGDRFKPAGMKGLTKKLKDFYIDEKIPRPERAKIPLLVTENDEIVWVIGYRMAEDYTVSSSSRRILIIKSNKPG